MKTKLLITFSFLLFFGIAKSQPEDILWDFSNGDSDTSYQQWWRQADSLNNLEFTTDARQVISTIEIHARHDKKYSQLIKALLKGWSLDRRINETGLWQQMQKLEKEITTMPMPHKAVLQSMIASAWLQVKWRNEEYSDVSFEPDTTHPSTWPVEKILQRAEGYLLASVHDTPALQQPAQEYATLLVRLPGADKLTPTLYDVLMWRLYEFYSREMQWDTDTAQPPVAVAYSPTNIFLNTVLTQPGTFSYRLKALRTLQALLKRYNNSGLTDALVLTEIKRIDFVSYQFAYEKRDSLQLAWYENSVRQYSRQGISAELMNRTAQLLYCNDEYYYYMMPGMRECNNAKALRYCNMAIENHPGEPGAEKCRHLKDEILKKKLEISVEYTNPAEEPFRLKVDYKNVQRLYLRYLAVESDTLDRLEEETYITEYGLDAEARMNALKSYPVVLTDSVDLPADTTYTGKVTEWYCKGLKEGHYVVLFSNTPNFVIDSVNISGYANFWSTPYVLYSSKETNNTQRFFIATINGNKPVKGVTLKITSNSYDNYSGGYKQKVIGEGVTGKNGSIALQLNQSGWDIHTEAYIKGKKILVSNHNASYYWGQTDGQTTEITFVTDREIYRPGQTIYFKGFVTALKNGRKNAQLVAGFTTKVELFSYNDEKLADLEVTSNPYGTFSGSFTIPYGKATGYFRISTENGSKGFRVEEYKQPKFQVTLDTIKGNPGYNDTVTVTGRAVSYAGNGLNGAQLVYTVQNREDWYNRRKQPNQQNTFIVADTVTLDDKGEFTIKFLARPRLGDLERTTIYTIEATVTDISGETQWATTNLSVGPRRVFAGIMIDKLVQKGENPEVQVTVHNLNDNPIPFSGTIIINELKSGGQVIKQSEWEIPENILIPSAIRDKYFKNVYASQEVTIGATVYTQPVSSTTGQATITPDISKLAQGIYRLSFEYLDNRGIKQTETQEFTLVDSKSKKAFPGEPLHLLTIRKPVEPGQTTEVIISSRCPKTRVLYYIERGGVPGELQEAQLNNNLLKLKVPVTEADRGGIIISVFTQYDNRFYTAVEKIMVPYSNKQLNVQVTSYRDKMLPGGKEEWQLKITGPNAQKVSAEIVASMYDASLDRFVNNRWYDMYRYYRVENSHFANPAQLSIGITNTMTLSWDKEYFYQGEDYTPANFNFYNWIRDEIGAETYGYGEGNGTYNTNALYDGVATYKIAEAGVAEEANLAYAPPAEGMKNQDKDKKKEPLEKNSASVIAVRANLQETAFFYPHLVTDDSGAVLVKFIAPEALTQWNFRAFAHTKELASGLADISSVTQKPLMVQPNLPRFLREGDEIYITTKVVNLSENTLNPNAVLEVYDATTGQPIREFNNLNIVQVSPIPAGISQSVRWKFTVPAGYGALKIVIKAYDGSYTDAEANTLPVLSDEILVTEALPLPFSGNAPKTYELKKLTQSGQSTTLKNHKLTIEFTGNPAWYAVQALPYMMEFPHECAEQVFNRYYANTLAGHIANSSPQIKQVFDSWKNAAAKGEQGSFISNLEKNEELKNILLAETPWLAEGKNETERKQRLGLLFDQNNLTAERQKAWAKLFAMQTGSGAFPWFGGMGDNIHISQYILAGIGRLNKITSENPNEYIQPRLLEYVNGHASDKYNALLKKATDTAKNQLDFETVQYLHAISYFGTAMPTTPEGRTALQFWRRQAAKYWPGRSRMEQAMIALALHRMGDKKTAAIIIEAFRQNALKNEETGMYWKEMRGGYSWTDAPIETQSVIIEAFDEITTDINAINQMRKWLLKQKQLTDWRTTRATADACYALLLNGTDWLPTTPGALILLGSQTLNPYDDSETTVEAGTGYFKKSFSGVEIKPEMGKVTIVTDTKSLPTINLGDGTIQEPTIPMAWGGLYWQYFEKLDKITPAQTPLSLVKQLWVVKNTDTGITKVQLQPGDKLKPGDKITVRILLKANNEMEYVHLKDMRAASLEPTDFLSGHQWQNGVGYYKSIRDASMNLFFDRLPKGQWMFEYDLRVSQAGTFQNGIATVQSMYAPEYTSHSSGATIVVEP